MHALLEECSIGWPDGNLIRITPGVLNPNGLSEYNLYLNIIYIIDKPISLSGLYGGICESRISFPPDRAL